MSEKKNIQLVEKLYNELFSSGDLSLADSLIDRNCQFNCPSAAHFKTGLAGFKKHEEMYAHAFPSKTVTIEEIFGSGDNVAVRWHVVATHERDLPGIPATGKSIDLTGTSLYRIKNGKITEIFQNWDELGMLTQLGVVSTKAYASQR